MHRARQFLILLVLAGLLVGLLPADLVGAREVTESAQVPGDVVVVRLTYGTRDRLEAVAGELDIWEVHPDEGYAVAAVTPAQVRWLQSLGYPLEIDAARTALLTRRNERLPGQGSAGIPGYPCYRTVEETYADMQDLADAYPSLVNLYDIGDSWEKVTPGGNAGYDILALRITNEDIPGSKPRFFLMAEIHAREYTTAELAMRFAEYLLQRYGSDPTVTFFVDYHELYVVPMTNPDGRKMAEGGQLWRKNTDNDDGCNDPNSWGTDLNRNNRFKWGCCGGSSGNPCAETYRGPSRGSEPETVAVMNIVQGIFQDWNGPNGDDEVPGPAPTNASGLLITLHSYSELILWPWGWTGADAPNGAQLQTIGQKFATYNGYTPQQSNDLYTTDGTTDDWSYGKLGIASFTFELGTDFFQDCSSFENTILPDNLAALLYAWSIARTPYMTAYGPDTLNIAALPAAATPGTPVQLTATVNDSQNGGQNVAGAEYYLLPLHDPTPPDDPGSGTPMSPADGSWNSSTENVVATVDTSALAPGTYILALRGRDAADNWGPLSATFLYIVVPGVSPTIEGYVRDAGTAAPLEASIRAGLFRAATDPATGYYSMTVVSGTYTMIAAATGYATATVSGIVAQDYQTVQQDFDLYGFCDVFGDDIESGNQGWTAQSPWAITTENSHSPSHSWTDSPGGNYQSNRNVALTSPVWDLTYYSSVALSFWHIYYTEEGWDYCYVEYSTDGGATWATAASYDGNHNSPWTQVTLPLPALDGQAQARIRFRLQSDSSLNYDGWHIDDVVLRGGGPLCTPVAPEAEFTSNSPVYLGDPVVFDNQTDGTPPISYGWDFGDGATSTEENPTHLYAAVGTFTVTLAATNSVGSSRVSHPVVVACRDLDAVTIAGPTSGFPGLYTFTTSYLPANATPPSAYLWDNGDTVSTSVRALDVGTYTLLVTATNCTDTVVSDSHTIVIDPVAVCTDVAGVELTQVATGTIYPGDAVAFRAELGPDDFTPPYTYTLALDGVPGPAQSASADPLLFEYIFVTTGSHSLELAVWNCSMSAPVTDAVAVMVEEPTQCFSLTAVTIAGPTGGPPGVYAFTTSYEPPYATPPIAYLWDNGDTTISTTRVLGVGTHTLVVTATNCLDVSVTDTHTIVIAVPQQFYVYLPLVFRGP